MALRFIAVATDGTVAGAQIDEIVEGDPIIIGRDEAVDFVIPEPTVSRRHVEVRATVDGWEIEDLGSRLGTWVNGKRIRAGEGIPFKAGDEIEVGIVRILFMGECRGNGGDTGEIAGELVRELEVVKSETAVGRVGSEMIAPVFGMVAGVLGLLAAVLL
jgi:pSer/pThr/pTyr-binding forkhead associated (FHA) protein